jgi:IS4 transposase
MIKDWKNKSSYGWCHFITKKKKIYYFLTNLFDLPAEQRALLYKKRWEIELLFKKIKQNFPLQNFMEIIRMQYRYRFGVPLLPCSLLQL